MSAGDNLQGKLFSTQGFSRTMPKPKPGPAPAQESYSAVPGRQLPMFMTPHEIHAQYQPLDGDRQNAPWDYDGRTGESTMRTHTSGGGTNSANPNAGAVHRGVTGWGRLADPPSTNRTQRMEKNYKRRDQGKSDALETDDELWDRKLDEAEYGKEAWSEKSNKSVSLAESIREEGVKKPIHLSTSQFGSQGKPEIVGGHHRLAVATADRPGDYIPVLHHRDISEAQRIASSSGNAFRYT